MDLSETSIVNATLWLLGFFSLLTWIVVLVKLGEWAFQAYRNRQFKQSADPDAASGFSPDASGNVTSQMARIYWAGQEIANQMPNLPKLGMDQLNGWHDLLQSSLQQQIQKEKSAMATGLGLLASFGSTSPFVGLFGTVWGIKHALQDISAKGSASLEVVAGPIGEALIATAVGIGVAIPAVLAYNFFVRINKGTVAKLEQFAANYLKSVRQQHLQQQTVGQHGISNPK